MNNCVKKPLQASFPTQLLTELLPCSAEQSMFVRKREYSQAHMRAVTVSRSAPLIVSFLVLALAVRSRGSTNPHALRHGDFGTLKLNMYERDWFNIYGFYYGD